MTEKIKHYLTKYREIIRYVIVGGFTTLIGWGVFFLLDLLFPSEDGSLLYILWNTVSWGTAVLFAYFASRNFVFNSQASTARKKRAEFFGFVLSRVFSLVLENILLLILKNMGVSEIISKIPVSVAVVVCNYITGRIVFKYKENH